MEHEGELDRASEGWSIYVTEKPRASTSAIALYVLMSWDMEEQIDFVAIEKSYLSSTTQKPKLQRYGALRYTWRTFCRKF